MAIHLLDIISLQDLQHLQDTLSQATTMGMVTMDLQGNHITTPSRFSTFCAMMRSNPQTEPHCRASAMALNTLVFEQKRPAQRPCRNLGLADGSAPIIFNGEHVASWKIGQCISSRLPDKVVRAFSREHSLDEEALLTAYKALPVAGPDAFFNACNIVSLFASSLFRTCHTSYQLRQANKEKAHIIATLDTALSNLEANIYVCDPHTMQLVFVNHRLAKLHEHTNLIGKKCHVALHGSSERCPFCRSSLLLSAGNDFSCIPHSWELYSAKTGRKYMVQDSLIEWHDGRMLQLSAYIDITEQNRPLFTEN